ncbi:MAG TPA: helix-turn-helix domain-containing protein, partial [Candidatus Binataceae bacterium]|nr:helix-turn-helix domain-containing protein [Candidatus Binataceae bacterium]
MDKMSVGEWKRLEAAERIAGAELTVKRAGELLGLSARQVRRIRRKVAKSGTQGVVHGNRGRRPWNRIT